MIYIDANIFIYALSYKKSDKNVILSQKFLTAVKKKKIEACTNVLTWDEVFYHMKQHHGEVAAIIAGQMLLAFPNLCFVDSTKKIIDEAQKICENFHTKPRDAIHSACSIGFCNGEIFSNDGDFDNITGINRHFN